MMNAVQTLDLTTTRMHPINRQKNKHPRINRNADRAEMASPVADTYPLLNQSYCARPLNQLGDGPEAAARDEACLIARGGSEQLPYPTGRTSNHGITIGRLGLTCSSDPVFNFLFHLLFWGQSGGPFHGGGQRRSSIRVGWMLFISPSELLGE
ncbi:hypothetical protein BJX96DRAFT_159723 [Aspergillus floccosus]